MDTRPVKIKAEYLTKKFELLPAKYGKNRAKSLAGVNESNQSDFWALRNVNFTIHDGECVGIIGLNGAGKSTLSNIISGQISQTTGNVEINGDVSIIAASAGMQNNLSGRENIRLKGLMMGMTNRQIRERMDEIIEFSELGPFIDQPVKTYSSGMKAKLGFSIMVHQDPDIMIIDEGLSVGDQTFVDKSQRKMFEFRDQGKTIVLVSHEMRIVSSWCDRVIWINYGEVKMSGTPQEVIPEYNKFAQWFRHLSREDQDRYKGMKRQEQLDYSITELRNEIVKENPTINRRTERELTGEVMDNHKLTIPSKTIIGICAFLFIWIAMLSMSNARPVQSLIHPRAFLLQHLFKDGTLNGTRPVPEESKTKKPEGAKAQYEASSSSAKATSSSKQASSSSSSKQTSSKKQATKRSTKKTTKQSKASSASSTSSTKISSGTYVVKAGDSLAAIADEAGVSTEAIQAANSDVDLSVIHPGQSITIPKASSQTVDETTQTDQGAGTNE